MKFDIKNPDFLQAAGNHRMVMRMTTSIENQAFFGMSANGVVYIDSIKNGEKVRKILVNPDNESVTIENDANTEIVVYGKVTDLIATDDNNTGLTSLDVSKNTDLTTLECSGNIGLTSLDLSNNTALTHLSCNACAGLTSLDVSKNTNLTNLDCANCNGLTSLDLSKNAALTRLSCNNCTGLMLLDIQNTALLADGSLANNTMTALKTIQLNGTSEWADLQIASWLEQYAPTGGKLYVNQGTLQEVTVVAEDKDWTIEYVA